MTLADKWNLAAKIWHTDKEAEEIRSFLKPVLRSKNRVLDAACGTGFHTKILYDLKKDVTASDISTQELDLLRKEIWINGVTIKQADWRTLSESFKNVKFNAIICLGTSIPFYKSWNDEEDKEQKNQLIFENEEMVKIIKEFSACLDTDGILVLGLSRHNEKPETHVELVFDKNESGETYKMTWKFDLDWKNRKRTWRSEIATPKGDIISFSIIGHLFDHEELKKLCKSVFSDVEIVDLNPFHYDKYIVCKNRKVH